jgi:L-gulonate 5-dehydrogenase
MLTAVLREYNKLVLEDAPVPVPDMGQVVVRVKSCGVCATDWKAVRAIRRNVKFPFVPGHEPSGIVAKVGAGVKVFSEGDEVILSPSGYCGLCRQCRLGNPHYCEHAFTTGGDGALMLSPTHILEREVPIENIEAFLDEASKSD